MAIIEPGLASGELAGLYGVVRIEFVPPATHRVTVRYGFESAGDVDH
jgi:hypothetical protein